MHELIYLVYCSLTLYPKILPSLGGLEPPSFRLTAERANQLRHRDWWSLFQEPLKLVHSLKQAASNEGAFWPNDRNQPLVEADWLNIMEQPLVEAVWLIVRKQPLVDAVWLNVRKKPLVEAVWLIVRKQALVAACVAEFT